MSGLNIADVSFDYGAKRALDGVSLIAAPGRFTALLGLNGAGKSTLFALISGLIATRRGRVLIEGFDIATNPRAALGRLGIVFQAQTLDLDLTVRHNLRYFGALHGMRGKELDHRIDAAMDRLDMRDRLGERAAELNGGHRRRMEIARALLHRPSIWCWTNRPWGWMSRRAWRSPGMSMILRRMKGRRSSGPRIWSTKSPMATIWSCCTRAACWPPGRPARCAVWRP